MSRETTEARYEAEEVAANWRAHKRFCVRCDAAARRRRWDDLCSVGRNARQANLDAASALAENRRLDRLPPPGQTTIDQCL